MEASDFDRDAIVRGRNAMQKNVYSADGGTKRAGDTEYMYLTAYRDPARSRVHSMKEDRQMQVHGLHDSLTDHMPQR